MAQVNFRVDDSVKARAESACAAMGLTMTAALNIFLTKVANERRIPFEITADPFYSERNIRYLEKKMNEYKSGTMKVAEHSLVEE